MTYEAHSTAPGASVRKLLSAAVVGFVLSVPASFAQAPANPGSLSPTAPAPLEAYTDPGWTGRPQAPAVLRKEAAAALVEGRRRCAREPAPARQECMAIVMADHRLMLSRIANRRAGR